MTPSIYRRPKFLEILLEIRREMALEADYDVDLFAERVRAGMTPSNDAAAAADVGAVPEPSTNGNAPATKTKVRTSRRTQVKITRE